MMHAIEPSTTRAPAIAMRLFLGLDLGTSQILVAE